MGKLTDWFGWLAGLIILLMALLVFCEVISRYAFHHAFMVADEYSAYLLVWSVFLGFGYTMKAGGHIRVTAVITRFSPKATDRLRLITLVILLAYVIVFAIYCSKLVFWTHGLGLRSETWIETPQYFVQIAMPIGLLAFAFEIILEIKQAARSPKNEGSEILSNSDLPDN